MLTSVIRKVCARFPGFVLRAVTPFRGSAGFPPESVSVEGTVVLNLPQNSSKTVPSGSRKVKKWSFFSNDSGRGKELPKSRSSPVTGIPVEGLDCKKVPPKHPSCDDHPRGSRALGTRKAGRDEGEEAPHLYIYKLPINRFSGRYVNLHRNIQFQPIPPSLS